MPNPHTPPRARVALALLTLWLFLASCSGENPAERKAAGGRPRPRATVSATSPAGARTSGTPLPVEARIPLRVFLGTSSAVAQPVRACRGKDCVQTPGSLPVVRGPAGSMLAIAVDKTPRRAWLEVRSGSSVRRAGLTPGTLMTYADTPPPGAHRLTVVLSWDDLETSWVFDLLVTAPAA